MTAFFWSSGQTGTSQGNWDTWLDAFNTAICWLSQSYTQEQKFKCSISKTRQKKKVVLFFCLLAPYQSQSWLAFGLHTLQYEVWEFPQQQLWPFHPFLQSPQWAGKCRRLSKRLLRFTKRALKLHYHPNSYYIQIYSPVLLALCVSDHGFWYTLQESSNKTIFIAKTPWIQ